MTFPTSLQLYLIPFIIQTKGLFSIIHSVALQMIHESHLLKKEMSKKKRLKKKNLIYKIMLTSL